MIYLSQMLGIPVLDSGGERIGVVNDLGIATGEVFPPGHVPGVSGPRQNALHDQLAQICRQL